jgi:hypothetical protein
MAVLRDKKAPKLARGTGRRSPENIGSIHNGATGTTSARFVFPPYL